ncbi:MAG: putative tellurium resistance membrane protein TerC [Planctomycetota bacterium]
MDWIFEPSALMALLSLTLLEIVLGVDNIVFISVMTGRLPEEQQAKARQIGLLAALVGRVVLLLSISWVMGLTEPWFSTFSHEVSGRDVILIVGGLFLLAKATHEIHSSLEGMEQKTDATKAVSFRSVIVQIMILDLVFSLDSVITAVGMADHVPVMITAIVIAIGIMMLSASAISAFIHKHPTVKMLALSFLLLVGTTLIAEGAHFHISKGYIYFAMAFSILVEMLNMRMIHSKKPVELRGNLH